MNIICGLMPKGQKYDENITRKRGFYDKKTIKRKRISAVVSHGVP